MMNSVSLWLFGLGTTVVVLNKMSVVATAAASAGLDFKLHAGYSAETSGNMLFIVH